MSQDLQDGAIFANRYRIVRCMARGGMGAVYEVIHLETERRRALKVMHAHILESDDLRGRFQREARVAAQVESEFIVDVFDAGVDAATEMPFLVMEFLRGEELGKRIRRVGRLSPAEVALYVHQTALALDRTHAANIVHRDLKPENLFLTEREDGPPRVKVLDFGIAKVVAEGTTSGAATQSIGTPLYMSPEQFNPRARLTGASDVFSLGMIAYTMLVGRPYWDEESKAGVNIFAFGTIASQGPKDSASARARKRGVTLPDGFDEWFATVTAAEPERRFSPATSASRELSRLLGVPLGGGGPSLLDPLAASQPPLARPGPVPPPAPARSAPQPPPPPPFAAPVPLATGRNTATDPRTEDLAPGEGPAPDAMTLVYTPSGTTGGPGISPPGPATPPPAAPSEAPASITAPGAAVTAHASLAVVAPGSAGDVGPDPARRGKSRLLLGLAVAAAATIGAVALVAGRGTTPSPATAASSAPALATTAPAAPSAPAPPLESAAAPPPPSEAPPPTAEAPSASIAAPRSKPVQPAQPGLPAKPKGKKRYTQD